MLPRISQSVCSTELTELTFFYCFIQIFKAKPIRLKLMSTRLGIVITDVFNHTMIEYNEKNQPSCDIWNGNLKINCFMLKEGAIKEVLERLDIIKKNKAKANELAQACNISTQQAQNLIYQHYANGNGVLDANDFDDLKQQILEQQRKKVTDKINAHDVVQGVDKDGDGKLSANELAQACNITSNEAWERYHKSKWSMLDANEFEKFLKLKQQRQRMTDKINANDVVQRFDKDGDGKLSANELAQACNITYKEAQNIIYQYDANGDGLLDEQEFEELKQQILEQQRQKMTNNINANDTIQSMDNNGDGKLSAIELANACMSLLMFANI